MTDWFDWLIDDVLTPVVVIAFFAVPIVALMLGVLLRMVD